VAKGDTCDAIAAAHNVNTTLVHENNPQINPDCSNIYIGEVLCVASSVIVPPPASGKSFPMPSTATPAVPSPTPQPTQLQSQPNNDDGDDDDDDLPWCDEL
jgi:LysM repeat protein